MAPPRAGQHLPQQASHLSTISFSSPSPSPSPPSPRNSGSNPAALASTLAELGFEPARTYNFEWLYSFPDARPLLSAIATTFRPEHVISADEARRFAQLSASTPLLPDTELCDAAAPLLAYRERSSPEEERNEHLAAEEEYLAHLEQEHALMTEIYSSIRNTEASAPVHSEGEEGEVALYDSPHANTPLDSPEHPLSQLHATLDQLEHLVFLQSGISPSHTRGDDDMNRTGVAGGSGSSAAAARLTATTVADYAAAEKREHADTERARVAALQQTGLSTRPHAEEDASLRMLVDAYARLCRNKALADADLARHTAVLSALTDVDASTDALDSTAASLQVLLDDSTRRAAATLGVRLDEVEDAAKAELWARLRRRTVAREREGLDEYIGALRVCLAALVEQRLRVVCVQKAIDIEASEIGKVMESLKVVSGEVGEQDCHTEPHAVAGELVLTASVNRLRISETESFSTEKGEDTAFREEVKAVEDLLTELRHQIGCDTGWVDLGEQPEVEEGLRKLENDLASNTVVLETLLRNRAKLASSMPSSS